ncbi:hypothetical protein MC885_003400, partial [Smutsia gigantea]
MGRAPAGSGPRTPTGPRVATSPTTGSLSAAAVAAAAAAAAAAVAAATTGLRATTGSKAMALRVRPPPSPIRCNLVFAAWEDPMGRQELRRTPAPLPTLHPISPPLKPGDS